MFQGLRQNSIFYILEKTDKGLKIQTGEVIGVTNPYPKYKQNNGVIPNFNQQPEMVVDVKVKIGDEEVQFQQLGANLSIDNTGNLIVSDNQDAINAEVDNIVRNSQLHIEAVPYHENIIKSRDAVKRVINPQFAKEKEQEEKIGQLEARMGYMDSKLDKMFDLLSENLEQRKSKTKSKED